MRYVYDNRKEIKQKGELAKKHVIENYTWSKIAMKAEKRLTDIFGKLGV
jgi:hypothetical protein